MKPSQRVRPGSVKVQSWSHVVPLQNIPWAHWSSTVQGAPRLAAGNTLQTLDTMDEMDPPPPMTPPLVLWTTTVPVPEQSARRKMQSAAASWQTGLLVSVKSQGWPVSPAVEPVLPPVVVLLPVPLPVEPTPFVPDVLPGLLVVPLLPVPELTPEEPLTGTQLQPAPLTQLKPPQSPQSSSRRMLQVPPRQVPEAQSLSTPHGEQSGPVPPVVPVVPVPTLVPVPLVPEAWVPTPPVPALPVEVEVELDVAVELEPEPKLEVVPAEPLVWPALAVPPALVAVALLEVDAAPVLVEPDACAPVEPALVVDAPTEALAVVVAVELAPELPTVVAPEVPAEEEAEEEAEMLAEVPAESLVDPAALSPVDDARDPAGGTRSWHPAPKSTAANHNARIRTSMGFLQVTTRIPTLRAIPGAVSANREFQRRHCPGGRAGPMGVSAQSVLGQKQPCRYARSIPANGPQVPLASAQSMAWQVALMALHS